MVEFLISNPSIIVAVIAVSGVLVTAWITLKNNNKNVLIKTVTEERAKWRSEIRDACSEFIKIASVISLTKDEKNLPRLLELKVQLKLRLNPSQEPKHHLDQSIIKLLDGIYQRLSKSNKFTHVDNDLKRLEEHVQKLLKQEWSKSKGEAISGKVGN
ncbi:hypothetical protein [Vibrio vulnificus]|uniref:hypothetical protein n=3 Tax=Vibrio vulnificus TaxID=672 RepID=UPI002D7DBD1F|nr:hypothetical protein [Vibrio cholerae]EKO3888710.1 hypothetical protein [Vibrio metschnikovii]EJL6950349.1 hypothetical protein [Vibrio cholerae]EKO3937352.1 hypothetical protein [Vibrio metschnikovii]EMC3732820.1 hypothetical protein [Vibrio cholerae]